jgi:transcription elongation factor GreA
MTTTETRSHRTAGRWIPMTREAFGLLELEADRLATTVGDSQSTAWADSLSGEPDAPTFVPNGEFYVRVERLEKLRSAIAGAHVVQPDGRIVVGSRITLSDADGMPETYVLVAPGQADARAGRISSDSPLGAVVLGRRAGDSVDVATSVGPYQMTVVRVE